MMKHKRTILIGSAIVALVALAGLSVVAFAQGATDTTPDGPLSAPGFQLLDGDQVALDPAAQIARGDRPAWQFMRERMRENLAQALGVSPEALDEARWTAFLTTLDEAVAEGHLAQQAADRLVAQALVRQLATRDELIAAGLGITVDQWQEAHDEGKTVRQLVDDLGLDATTIGQNLAAFLENLILQAAGDGLIDEQQAQRILEDEFLDRLARGLWRPWLRPHRPAPLRDRG